MKEKIIDLNEVYKQERMFYWCNCAGDINVPGDFKAAGLCHTSDDIPPKAKDLYENYWSELNCCCEYVVTLDGTIGYVFGFPLDRDWYLSTLSIEQSQLKEIAIEQAEKMFGASGASNLKILYGCDTDPTGDELLVFLPYEDREHIRAIAAGTNSPCASDTDDRASGKYDLYSAIEAYVDALVRNKYVVCLDSSFIRDAQMLETNGLSDEEISSLDFSAAETEVYWHDMEPDAFVDIVEANSEENACKMAARKSGYDERCLFAVKV